MQSSEHITRQAQKLFGDCARGHLQKLFLAKMLWKFPLYIQFRAILYQSKSTTDSPISREITFPLYSLIVLCLNGNLGSAEYRDPLILSCFA